MCCLHVCIWSFGLGLASVRVLGFFVYDEVLCKSKSKYSTSHGVMHVYSHEACGVCMITRCSCSLLYADSAVIFLSD